MTRNIIVRTALFAATFFAIIITLDHAFGFKTPLAKEAVEAAAATLGWMLALKWRNGTIA
jgi:hypothetical protein